MRFGDTARHGMDWKLSFLPGTRDKELDRSHILAQAAPLADFIRDNQHTKRFSNELHVKLPGDME